MSSFVTNLQSLTARLESADHRWLILTAFAVILIAVIFALDKPQALMWLLVIYTLGFVAFQLPPVEKQLMIYLSESDIWYAKLIIGGLPILTLAVLKFKKKRK